MRPTRIPRGHRERAKQDKRERIMTAARDLFAEQGVSGVTTQQIARRADVAIGTLYLYASTKAELLIMVQNEKFATAVEDGLAAATAAAGQGLIKETVALIRPVVECVREQVENGRTYLQELVFGDPTEPYRREGLGQSARLEEGLARVLTCDEAIDVADAATLARVMTAIIHLSITAADLDRSVETVLADIREQMRTILEIQGRHAGWRRTGGTVKSEARR